MANTDPDPVAAAEEANKMEEDNNNEEEDEAEEEEDERMQLHARKPDWDLKRDIEPKLAKLQRRTHRAIVQILRTFHCTH